jgi:hypothetical protein
MFVQPTTDRAQLTRGINALRLESRGRREFSETIVEYAERVDKDFKDKKLTTRRCW